MKYLLILITIMLVGCATTPTMKSVAGTYEMKKDGDTYRAVLLENGVFEEYENGKKEETEHKWSISKEGEIHVEYKHGWVGIGRINPDGSTTGIAVIIDGKRTDIPKEEQPTSKKIK